MFNPVGFWRRLGANLIDGIIVGLALSLISFLILGESVDTWITTVGDSLYSLILPLVWSGYTIGKRMIGIRIVKIDGTNVDVWTMIKREIIGGLVYMATFGIGVIISAFMVGLREDKRAIHDFIAGTYVTDNLPESEY